MCQAVTRARPPAARYEHSVQTATRAHRAGAGEEMVALGLDRTVALHYRSSTLYQTH
jgi:predicted HD phosphohydrolase